MNPRALIADDEPLLREVLRRRLAELWPALQIVAEVRNGREAIEQVRLLQPELCFLDVHMPGLSGVEAARQIAQLPGRQTHLVFVTAFEQYALQAFEHGVLDYLVKPVTPTRLAETVRRLQARLDYAQAPVHSEQLLQQLAAQLARAAGEASPGLAPLRWVRATVAGALRMIPVEAIAYLRADTKYTLVAWREDDGSSAEALIRLPLKELLAQLDGTQFVQVHRAVVVNLSLIQSVLRGDNETAEILLKGRPERLPVSRSYLHLFREM
ncbi:DNA-binding LytR/AlgR family response regulator [Paucibacter oligotrophus]|uniref:DNA-binding LytR/AlgR family response regulator n=1 Tax=Roseateles oligotrophus TaxID=1769250 RepID=A0A840L8K5_9BURK|nr:LytTR family DNA-binding domain-containing protein [Roseateles oligotrophus]MBB4843055.1 DNA-binding LytR/AlgR family response regulator [Roseateles oligotrophus]